VGRHPGRGDSDAITEAPLLPLYSGSSTWQTDQQSGAARRGAARRGA